jgi:hypothetical protein
MNVIEIVITGIVYLLGPSGNPATATAILPNFGVPSAPFGHVVADHYPYVRVRTGDVDQFWTKTAARMPDFVYRKKEGAIEYALYHLAGDEVKFTGQNLPPLDVCDANEKCGDKLNGTEKVRYSSIPGRADVCPQCGKLQPEYKTSKDPELVAGRVLIDHGHLAAGNLKRGVVWTFAPLVHRDKDMQAQNRYHRQETADQAVIALNTEQPVTLTLTPFMAHADHQPLSLVLKPGAEVEIGNMMPNDILPMKMQHDPESVDPHFSLYYTMLSGPVPHDPPLPERTPYPVKDEGGARQNCVPLRGASTD